VRKLAIVLSLAALPAAAQISVKPADAIVPVVGSTRGQSNANFKTELQLANGTEATMAGWLVLRPQNLARRYELAPHTTLSFADVVADLGASGLGSIDILVDRGAVPTIVARAFDDQPGGTTGVTVPAVAADQVLDGADTATLIVPRDLVRYRFNIGVRTLSTGATLQLIVRATNGTERHRRIVTFGDDHFEQQPGDLFVDSALQPDDSIEIHILAGSAIVYATTVDNRTNDSSIQIAR
jgi:hypothetical protein